MTERNSIRITVAKIILPKTIAQRDRENIHPKVNNKVRPILNEVKSGGQDKEKILKTKEENGAGMILPLQRLREGVERNPQRQSRHLEGETLLGKIAEKVLCLLRLESGLHLQNTEEQEIRIMRGRGRLNPVIVQTPHLSRDREGETLRRKTVNLLFKNLRL